MKKKLTFGIVIWFIIIAYLLIGLVLSLAGISQRAIAGKGETFSPLVGITLDMIGWPLNMKAAYMNGIFGIQFFSTLAAKLIAFILFIVMLFRKRNKV